MSEGAGEKTEQPTPKRLEEAFKHGEIARSAEVQTVFVLLAGLTALSFCGGELWRHLARSMTQVFARLAVTPLSADMLQAYAVQGTLLVAQCVGPVVAATVIAGLLAGALQNRFRTSPEALEPNWERLNPVPGLQRMFSLRSMVPGLLASVRLAVIALLAYSEIRKVVADPIFYTAVDVARIAEFLAASTGKIVLRIAGAMVVLAAADYAYQLWRKHRDLMMTREELKEETKNAEGNPEIKARQRRLRMRPTLKRMLADVPKADVVITNPTHLAVALRYDRHRMKAPRVVAKGARLNALRIREVATQHQVPLLENKPLARLLFKHGRVGGEIPAELYVAVAEVLAWVYRVNRFRYYHEQNQTNHQDAVQSAAPTDPDPSPAGPVG